MQSVVLPVVIALFPIGLILALLQLSTWRQRMRLTEIAQQIAVTDAIHAALGAVVSPVVRKKLWRGWRLTIAVPFDRPDTVRHVVDAASRAFGPAERTRPGRFEIVLTPQEQPVPRRMPVLVPAGTAGGESVSWT
jgi:hypothetical protein